MKNVMDIIERFQTHHALKEEREMENSHASENGAAPSSVPFRAARNVGFNDVDRGR